jgi:hypothetical protein
MNFIASIIWFMASIVVYYILQSAGILAPTAAGIALKISYFTA